MLQSKDIEQLNGEESMTHTYAAYKRPSQDKRHTQTEREGLETNFPSKWKGKKKAGVAILISDKIDFKKKGHIKRPRRSLHNTQGKNPSRKHKHCEHICTQIYKENLGGLQERYRQQHNCRGF